MDFFERWFGVAPDGGDGTLELLYIALIVSVTILLTGRRWIARILGHRIARFRDGRTI